MERRDEQVVGGRDERKVCTEHHSRLSLPEEYFGANASRPVPRGDPMVEVDGRAVIRPKVDRFPTPSVEGVPGRLGPSLLAVTHAHEDRSSLDEPGRLDDDIQIYIRTFGSVRARLGDTGPFRDDEGDPPLA